MVNDKLSDDPLEIANEFNNFFVSIGSKLANNIRMTSVDPITYLKPKCINSMMLFPSTSFEVNSIIKSLKNSTSVGIDGIPVAVIKSACSYISDHLATLI